MIQTLSLQISIARCGDVKSSRSYFFSFLCVFTLFFNHATHLVSVASTISGFCKVSYTHSITHKQIKSIYLHLFRKCSQCIFLILISIKDLKLYLSSRLVNLCYIIKCCTMLCKLFYNVDIPLLILNVLCFYHSLL